MSSILDVQVRLNTWQGVVAIAVATVAGWAIAGVTYKALGGAK